MPYQDHFSSVAAGYADTRPGYPAALFDWIAAVAPGRALAWEAGCGSGQATRDLAQRFRAVHASDPSVEQLAKAGATPGARFVVEPAERCSLPDASADAACVAQALHWFDPAAYFAECRRVLRPGGVLVAWGYQDIELPPAVAEAAAGFRREIAPHWPAERALVDAGHAGFDWPFEDLAAPRFDMVEAWTLPRLLGYFGSFSATSRHRRATGRDPVAAHAGAIAAAWGDPGTARVVRWPLFVHARRKRA